MCAVKCLLSHSLEFVCDLSVNFKFRRLLCELRVGIVSESSKVQLLSRINDVRPMDMEEDLPTLLFPKNSLVDAINAQYIEKINSREVVYDAIDQGDVHYLNGVRAPKKLRLKVGAQVMLLKNLSVVDGLVNGTCGIVKRFSKAKFNEYSNTSLLPLVEFTVSVEGKVRRLERVIHLAVWEMRDINSIRASRRQIPLMLAWALTIHKAQGMTIPHAKVSFSGMFQCGQAYVAISRVKDLQSLSLSDFDESYVRANEKVRTFYSSLGHSRL